MSSWLKIISINISNIVYVIIFVSTVRYFARRGSINALLYVHATMKISEKYENHQSK